MNYNSKELYRDYIKEYPNSKITQLEFTAIITEFNYSIGEKIINLNYRFYLGFNLAYLMLVKVERSFNKMALDFGRSNKLKKKLIEEGKEPAKKIGVDDKGNPILSNENTWMVFFTNDFYPAFTFFKVKNSYGNLEKKVFRTKHIAFWKFEVTRIFRERMYKDVERGKVKVEYLRRYNGRRIQDNIE